MLKKPFFAVLGLFLVLSLTTFALAQSPRGDRDDDDDRYGPRPRISLTDEQRKTWDKLWDDYVNRIYPLRSQLQDQRLLYNILADQNQVNVAEVKALIAEMRKTRDQLRAESLKFKADVKASGLPEILGVHADGPDQGCVLGHRRGGRGYKRGWRGPGRGYGQPWRNRDRGFDRDRDRDVDDEDE
ncbi:MAG: periplasmic heavy metal sensor [Deltaproteobacteria bacterium]|jgi:Spy/CpxP family protein refolding chaperone|nr:periplasmic heavy metal sensor [Deltaproteobacteria bacterium]